MANFPTSLPSFSNPTGSDYLNSPAHATQHGNNNDETVAIATKIGTGSSTPVANKVLKGSGTGTSSWSSIPTQSEWVTASDGATVTFDLSAGNKQVVTLGGNRTLALSNVLSGHTFILKLIQDGTGSRTVTWFSTVNWRGTGGSAPTLSTAVSAVDVLGFIQTAANTYDGFIVSQS
jgi:hypothetical protein